MVNLWVYDIGYRLTGSLEYINLKEVCGYDPLDMLIRFALTGDMGEPDIAKKADPYFGESIPITYHWFVNLEKLQRLLVWMRLKSCQV